MSKVAIVGAGRVGIAAAKLLLTCTEAEIVLIDSKQEALEFASKACIDLPRSQAKQLANPDPPVTLFLAPAQEQIEQVLKSESVAVVMCCTPFYLNVDVATAALNTNAHYLDFTEDVEVAAQIKALNPTRNTFVPQTGLAPGLVSYVGLSLFEELDVPSSLSLRVGALPQVSFSPAHYAITWSTEGLINEYLKPSVRKVDGEIVEVPSLDDEETIISHGQTFQAFTTSGGAGNLEAYESIPTVEYKTIRYPGHLDYIHKLLSKVDFNFEEAVQLANNQFVSTRDDVVILIAYAVDTSGRSSSAGLRFYPNAELDLTALELTTAGTGVAIVELLLDQELPSGVLNCSQIPLEQLMQTVSMQFVFEHLQ